MTELEQLKTELQKYKVENDDLRTKSEKIKGTISFRLGNILVLSVQSYKGFFRLPLDLYRLRSDVTESRKELKSIPKDDVIELCKHDQFILRDSLVKSSISVKSEELTLSGKVFSEIGEKKNAAVLVFYIDGEQSKELSAKIGVSWSDKIGMFCYLPTVKIEGEAENEFTVKLRNLEKSILTVGSRKWHSKNSIKLSGSIKVVDADAEFKKVSASKSFMIYQQLYRKANVVVLIEKINKDKKLSQNKKGMIGLNMLLGLGISDRADISLLVNFVNDASLSKAEGSLKNLADHLFAIGCYVECLLVVTKNSLKYNKSRVSYLKDVVSLKGGTNLIPSPNAIRLSPVSSTIRYVIHCSQPHHSNGYATRSHSVLTAVQNNGTKITALTRPGYPWDVRFVSKPSDDLIHKVDAISYEHLGGPSQRDSTITEYIEAASRALESYLLVNGARVVHACSNYLTAYPALIAARRLGIPFVYEVRGFWEITELSRKPGWELSDKFQLDRIMETNLLLEADSVITLTNAMKSEIELRGVAPKRVFVMPNAVDLSKFEVLDKDQEIKNDLGLNESVIIGYIGSIVDYEGLDDLLTACKDIYGRGIDIKVLIVGDGAALNGLKQQVKSERMEDYVIFTGRVPHEDVSKYYSVIDIAPFPRKNLEVCELVSPLKPFEAMALKKAVVASNVNAIKEFIDDSKNGLLFTKGDIQSLTETLLKVILDENLRSRISEDGRTWVEKNRNWSSTTQCVEEVYALAEELMAKGSGQSTLGIKETAEYYLGNEKVISLDESKTIDCIVDSHESYHLSGTHDATEVKSALVSFKLKPEISREGYVQLGYHWSDAIGAFKYLPIQQSKVFEIPFKTGELSKSIELAFHPWNNKEINVGNKVELSKAFNGRKESVKELIEPKDKINIALYGDVNTNLIDGASIWLISLAKTLATLKNVNVHVFLKDKIRDSEVLDDSYTYSNIYLIEPDNGPMKPEAVVASLRAFEMENGSFSGVIVRGAAVCHEISNQGFLDGRLIPYLTDIPQSEELLTDEWNGKINDIVYSSKKILCQTPELEAFFARNFPKADTSILPPMVPSFIDVQKPNLPKGKQRIVYAGKFAPEWGIRELFSVFRALQSKNPSLELHIYGDKIHNPIDDKSFYKETLDNLKSGNGIIWHGRASRKQVLAALVSANLSWAWRHASLEDNTKELSTKLLEYGLAKVPVLLNTSPLYVEILGKDFELFAKTESELIAKAQFALSRKVKATKMLTAPLERLVKLHSFDYVANTHLAPVVSSLAIPNKKVVLIAGHDLKFFTHLEAELRSSGYRVIVDKWDGHNKHNLKKSQLLIKQADTVICEWCLGNAVWYSEHVNDNQNLHIRVHGQEIKLDYFNQINISNVKSFNFVSQHLLDDAIIKYKILPKDKCKVIPNYVLTEKLDRPKVAGAEFNIGLVGIVPEMKRLDKALDILEEVRSKDKRFKLYIKGKKPEDYPWMKNRPEEMAYYEKQYVRIKENKLLKDAVIFDGFGPDMAEWYRKIGYVLSTSDYESFHLSVADCLASGGQPVVFDWDGAESLYGENVIFTDKFSAAGLILNSKASGSKPGLKYKFDAVCNSWFEYIT